MLKRLLFILCSWLFASPVIAQDVTVYGHANDFKGETIGIYSFKDLITNTPFLVASAKVNDTGYYSLTLHDVKQSQYMYLNIQNCNGSIYIEPNGNYNVDFPPPDSVQYLNPYVTHPVDLVFIDGKASDINSMVIDFNEQWDIFWRQYYTYFVRKQATSVLDSFRITMIHRYADVNNDYFHGYVAYTIAEMEISILVGQKTLAKRYLQNKPILYHNYEYMKFFNDYFKDYMEMFAVERQKEGDEVTKFIETNDYVNLMEVLKVNPLLRSSDSLCELVLLKGLYDLYFTGDYNKENIKTILRNISTNSKIDEDKVIAKDILASFVETNGGEQAPEFTLKDSQGGLTSLIDFRGKYVYLCFFKSSVSECVSEMDVMSALRRQYGKKINFVCVSEDDSLSQMMSFLDQNKIYNWTFLFDKNHEVLKLYDVKATPEFFLLNPKGKFYKSPADAPSHGIETTFDIIAPQKTK